MGDEHLSKRLFQGDFATGAHRQSEQKRHYKDTLGCLTPDSSLALFDCTNMERKYWGLHRSTMHNMTKRAKMAYYAATDDPSLPSTSSLVTESSPEPSMPHLSPEMYSVVQFVCDDSLAVVANSWLVGDNLVAWPKDRELQRLLEADRRPTDGARLYEVKVLKDGLDLDKARRIAQKAEHTDHLSSSEPERLGRGMRTKFPRRLTSDSEEDDKIQEIRKHTDRRLGPWPAPPAVLRLPDGENLAPEIRNLLKEMKQELACQRKKLDFILEEMVWVKTHIQNIEAKQADNRRALQAVSFVSKVKPPLLQLPLRTAEAYKDFLTKIGSDNELAQETEPAVDENFRQHNDAV
nr:unnamed protein product [Spirometra erinaceieuropaei]